MPRLYVDVMLKTGAQIALPEDAVRHVQVLRLQPGDELELFDGSGLTWRATVVSMGKREASVEVGDARKPDTESTLAVELAVGVPANDRMDFVVEKATELGAAGLRPLMCERAVVRLDGERAARRVAHWQGVAIAAAEQSGRVRLPTIAGVQRLGSWLDAPRARLGWMLSFAPDAKPIAQAWADAGEAAMRSGITLLSGPEGGLSPEEERRARDAGFEPVSLGPRVLRADTAPLAALAVLMALAPAGGGRQDTPA